MKKINHSKYTHFALPPYFILPKKTKGTISGAFRFGEKSKYVISPENQGDINKMLGCKSSLTSQQDDGVMIGWNYDNKRDVFSVCLYVHGGSGKGFKPPKINVGSGNAFMSTLIDVNVDVEYRFKLSLTQTKASLVIVPSDTNKPVTLTLGRDKTYINGWFINPYFGGQECASCCYDLTVNI